MVDFSSIGRRVATQVVNNGLQKVAGNVKGLLSGGKKGADSSDFRDLHTQGSDTKTFQFPLDVTQGPGLGNHGHYIMFFINEQKHAKLRFSGGVAQKNGEDLIAESIRRDTPAYINEMVSDVKSGTEIEADLISRRLRNHEFDTDNYAVRIRRYPKSNHSVDVDLWNDEKEFW